MDCKAAGSSTRLLFLLFLLFAESFQWLLEDGDQKFEERPELPISKQNILAQVLNKRLLKTTQPLFDLDRYKELRTGDEAGGENSYRRFKLKTGSSTVGIYECLWTCLYTFACGVQLRRNVT